MSRNVKIKVSSKSFSRHPVLRKELLAAFPYAEFNDKLEEFTADNFAAYIDDSEGIVVGLEPVIGSVLAKCPNLELISKFGVGLDNIDKVATDKHNVKIGWTGGVNRRSVSEMTLCFMIGLSRHILFSSRNLVGLDDWNKSGGYDLSNQIVGIIGVGYIGKDLVTLLKPFGCTILVNDIIDQADYYQANGLIASSKEEIYAQADIVTIHTPLDEITRGFCNADTFRQMKETGYFVNCARGGLVVQADLKQALLEGAIAGAAIDVFESEPSDDYELINLPNLICTPHIGGSSDEAVLAMGRSAIKHLVGHFGC
jgi:phosphoglycerate dehydrogenase-like enzyme